MHRSSIHVFSSPVAIVGCNTRARGCQSSSRHVISYAHCQHCFKLPCCRRRRFDARLAVEEANDRFYAAFQVSACARQWKTW